MTGDDVAYFMGHHPSEFGFRISQRNQSSGDVYVAARKRERVNIRRIEDRKREGRLGAFGIGRQAAADLSDVGPDFGIIVHAAIADDDFGVLLSTNPRLFRFRHEQREILLPRGGIRGARRRRC